MKKTPENGKRRERLLGEVKYLKYRMRVLPKLDISKNFIRLAKLKYQAKIRALQKELEEY